MSYRDCFHCRHWDTCTDRKAGCKAARDCQKYDAVIVLSLIPGLADSYNTLLDRSTANGILRVTHEIDLSFKMVDGAIQFLGAWELGCSGDWEYNEHEAADFEDDHPGLLKEVEQAIKAGNVRYTT